LLVLLAGLAAQGEKRRRRRLLGTTRSLDDIAQLSWQQFEVLVAEAFRHQNWTVSEVGTIRGGGGDGGVDLVLRRTSEVVAVQCKRWVNKSVGVEKVRELEGALADFGAQRGIFVTLGGYTREAHDFATRRRMQLIGGRDLLRLLPSGISTVPMAPGPPPVTCPRCGSVMVRRWSQRYDSFWGCRQYPRCRGTRPIANQAIARSNGA
jgi:restriction system protein